VSSPSTKWGNGRDARRPGSGENSVPVAGGGRGILEKKSMPSKKEEKKKKAKKRPRRRKLVPGEGKYSPEEPILKKKGRGTLPSQMQHAEEDCLFKNGY